jgi:hypothetical protein
VAHAPHSRSDVSPGYQGPEGSAGTLFDATGKLKRKGTFDTELKAAARLAAQPLAKTGAGLITWQKRSHAIANRGHR